MKLPLLVLALAAVGSGARATTVVTPDIESARKWADAMVIGRVIESRPTRRRHFNAVRVRIDSVLLDRSDGLEPRDEMAFLENTRGPDLGVFEVDKVYMITLLHCATNTYSLFGGIYAARLDDGGFVTPFWTGLNARTSEQELRSRLLPLLTRDEAFTIAHCDLLDELWNPRNPGSE